jgi:hypothetical protein
MDYWKSHWYVLVVLGNALITQEDKNVRKRLKLFFTFLYLHP